METLISSTRKDTSLLNSNYDEDGTYYPDSDGLPMANSTLHGEYITTTKYGIESVFADRDDVFVAADVFWYPVKGKTRLAVAPDVMVAVGRPKGARRSYKQWNEGNIAPQVVFEFLSDSNTAKEMTRKAIFFERYGVQEYYLYDVERKELSGFIRFLEQDLDLEEIPEMNGWKSPRLGITFDMSSGELVLRKPDGEPFLSYMELEEERKKIAAQLERAESQLERVESQLSESESRATAMAAKLRELGINPDEL